MDLNRGKRRNPKKKTLFLNRLVLAMLLLNLVTTPMGLQTKALADESSISTNNTIQDAGFESFNDLEDTDYTNEESQYWKTSKGNIATGLSGDSHSGNHSLYLTPDNSSSEVYQDIALTPEESVTFTLWVKGSETGGPLTIYAGDQEIYSSTVEPSAEWTQITTDSFTVPIDESTTRLELAVTGEATGLFVDDIKLATSKNTSQNEIPEEYEMTEEYVDENNKPIEGQPDSTSSVPSETTYSKTPPTISGYSYQGYKVDDDTSFETGEPHVSEVTGPHTVKMKYVKNEVTTEADNHQLLTTNETLEISPKLQVTNGDLILSYENKEFAMTDDITNEDLLEGVVAYNIAYSENLSSSVKITSSNVDPGVPGIYQVTYEVEDSHDGKISATAEIFIKDDPRVTTGGKTEDETSELFITSHNLVFESTDTVDNAKLLEDVVAFDHVEGDISASVIVEESDVVSGTPGIYNVTFKAFNSSNDAVIREIHVLIKDSKTVGPDPYITAHNQLYTTSNNVDDKQLLTKAQGFDEYDGDLSSEVKIKDKGGLVSGVPGVYSVTYEVSDHDKPVPHTISKTVEVCIIGGKPAGGTDGTPYLSASNKVFDKSDVVTNDNGGKGLLNGVIGFDIDDGDLTSDVKIAKVDGNPELDPAAKIMEKTGIHTVTYTVTDSKGNETEKEVLVFVTDTSTVTGSTVDAPYITAPNKVYLKSDTVLNDASEKGLMKDVVGFDLIDGDLTDDVKITKVDGAPSQGNPASKITGIPGIHIVTYWVIDSKSPPNITTNDAEVFVQDETTTGGVDGAPYISAPNKVFDDADVVDDAALLKDVLGFDQEDGTLTDDVTITKVDGTATTNAGAIISGKPGVYTVTYSLTDSDNHTTENEALVFVKGPTTSGGEEGAPYITAPNKVFALDDVITNNASEKGLMKDVTAFDLEDGVVTSDVTITHVDGAITTDAGTAITGKPGTHTVTYSVTDSTNKTTTREVEVYVKDETTTGGENGAPYISAPNKVYGQTDLITNDAGAKGLLKDVTAFDVEDGAITKDVTITKLDGVATTNPGADISGKPGIYKVTYSVTDSDGLTTTNNAEVLVTGPNTSGGANGAPYITAGNKVYKQSDVITNGTGANGLLKDVTAFDKEDGTITGAVTITEVDGEATTDAGTDLSGKSGIHTVTYSVTDSDNKTTTKEVQVFIGDHTTTGGENGAPYISAPNKVFEETDVVTNGTGANGLLKDVIAFDEEDGEITDDIQITKVNDVATGNAASMISGKPGIYAVTYSVKDSDGKTATNVAEVLVKGPTTSGGENGAPYINAPNKVYDKSDIVTNGADAKGLLKDVTAFDEEDGTITGAVTITMVDGVATNDAASVLSGKLGTYQVTYSVTDSDAKVTTRTVEVLVKDQTTEGGKDGAPYITAPNKVYEQLDVVTNGTDANGLMKDVTAFDIVDGTIADGVTITKVNGKTTNDAASEISGKPGIYQVTYSVSDSDGKVTTKDAEVLVKGPSTVGGTDGAPYITAETKIYEKTDVVTNGTGAKGLLKDVTAFDEKDGTLTEDVTITKVDGKTTENAASLISGKPGIYQVTYSVTDSDNKTTTSVVDVFVKNTTTTGGKDGAPYITAGNKVYEQTDVITNDTGDYGLLKDVVAFDEEDGELTDKVTITLVNGEPTDNAAAVLSGKPGIYQVTYSVTDSDAKVTTNEVEILVKDHTTTGGENGKPYITAPNKVYEKSDVITNDAGALGLLKDVTGFDQEDGTLTDDVKIIKVDGKTTADPANVLSGKPGIYDVTYSLTDSDKNITEMTVSVFVKDKAPVTGGESPYITAADKVFETTDVIDQAALLKDVLAFDLEDGDLTSAVTIKESNVVSGVAGDYTVTYTVTDKAGNTFDKQINVKIQDTVPPLKPVINPIDPGDTVITGTGEPGATIEITLPNGEIVTAPIDENGNWEVTSPAPLKPGEVVTGVVITSDGNKSPITTATVGDEETPKPGNHIDPPIINPVDPGDEIVTGTGEPGTIIQVTLPGGETVTTVVNPDGSWSVQLPRPALPGDVITAIAIDEDGNKSTEATITVPAYATGTRVPKTGDENQATSALWAMLAAGFILVLVRTSNRKVKGLK